MRSWKGIEAPHMLSIYLDGFILFHFLRRYNLFKGPETSTLILAVCPVFYDWLIETISVPLFLTKWCKWAQRADNNLFHSAIFFFKKLRKNGSKCCAISLQWRRARKTTAFSIIKLLDWRRWAPLFQENSFC